MYFLEFHQKLINIRCIFCNTISLRFISFFGRFLCISSRQQFEFFVSIVLTVTNVEFIKDSQQKRSRLHFGGHVLKSQLYILNFYYIQFRTLVVHHPWNRIEMKKINKKQNIWLSMTVSQNFKIEPKLLFYIHNKVQQERSIHRKYKKEQDNPLIHFQ